MGYLLVSGSKIKAFTNINDNVDEAILLSNIQVAQDLGLQGLLGTKFMNEIISKAQSNSLNAAETTLVQDYIAPYLIQRAYYESIPNIWMRVMNKSITIGNTEQGGAASASDMKYLRSITQDRYEFYAQRLLDWLKNNPNDYPSWYSWSSTDGMPPSKNQNYFGGFHISNSMPRHLPAPGIKGYLDPSSDLLCCD